MFSKIQDLDRYKNDLKRFRIAIECVEGEEKQQGQYLLDQLVAAVVGFDSVMENLIIEPGAVKLDHATAQKRVLETKTAIENWVLKHAPNVHVENG
jgi:hypothetical protein